MAHTKTSVLFLSLALLFSVTLLVDAVKKPPHKLCDDYYKASCPQAESVISKTFSDELDKDLRNTAGIIRMAFHDCFVEGCDGSVLLDGDDTEKTADVNEHLRGFEVVDVVKSAVEAICPGVVSCADLIAYGARESTLKVNGTGWVVQGGRKDGFVSSAETAESELPPPTFGVSELIDSFAKKGLTKHEMVILSGSHTIGVGHCNAIIGRLYNFNATHFTDPTLNATLAEQLKDLCPEKTFNTSTVVIMDALTPTEFDSNYYSGLTQRNDLFTSDQSLFEDRRTKKLVKSLVNERRFERKFGEAMRAMGRIGVKTGAEGEVRLNCRKINSK